MTQPPQVGGDAESVLAGRNSAGEGVTLVDLTKAGLAKVREAIVGKTIVVRREDGTEKVKIVRVTFVKNGTVSFNDGNKSRSVKATAIIATR